MAQQDVIIGRAWPSMPTYSRITIGTREEMDRFQVAFQKVMNGTVTGRLNGNEALPVEQLDGYIVRA
jgi:histidinol-phosphate aminotransferase